MPGHSEKTEPVAFRLPIEVYGKILKRVQSKRSRYTTVAEYLKQRIIYDATRKHGEK